MENGASAAVVVIIVVVSADVADVGNGVVVAADVVHVV